MIPNKSNQGGFFSLAVIGVFILVVAGTIFIGNKILNDSNYNQSQSKAVRFSTSESSDEAKQIADEAVEQALQNNANDDVQETDQTDTPQPSNDDSRPVSNRVDEPESDPTTQADESFLPDDLNISVASINEIQSVIQFRANIDRFITGSCALVLNRDESAIRKVISLKNSNVCAITIDKDEFSTNGQWTGLFVVDLDVNTPGGNVYSDEITIDISQEIFQ